MNTPCDTDIESAYVARQLHTCEVPRTIYSQLQEEFGVSLCQPHYSFQHTSMRSASLELGNSNGNIE
jgi:hypothetical protein